MGSLPETKPQIETIQQKSRLSFCWIPFHVGDVPGLCTITGAVMASCLMEMTTYNSSAYAKAGAGTGLTTLDLKL